MIPTFPSLWSFWIFLNINVFLILLFSESSSSSLITFFSVFRLSNLSNSVWYSNSWLDVFSVFSAIYAELDIARSIADLAVLSIFLIKPITSSYYSVILFSIASICSSRLANLLSIRLRILAIESLAGNCGWVMEDFGGLLTVFDCFVEGISGKDSCSPTLWVIPMQEIKVLLLPSRINWMWVDLFGYSLLYFGWRPYAAIMNTKKRKNSIGEADVAS